VKRTRKPSTNRSATAALTHSTINDPQIAETPAADVDAEVEADVQTDVDTDIRTNIQLNGTITAAHGRHYVVAGDDGIRWTCFTRGKKSEAACGDRVELQVVGPLQGVILRLLPRRNLLYRSALHRKKLLAANVTQLMIVLAADPPYSEDLLGRALVSSEVLDIPVIILLNKADLIEPTATARARLARYSQLGYDLIEASVRRAPDEACQKLLPRLRGQTTVMLGQSGMGKSSLLNLLVPDADAQTREISQALHTGRHTTTFTRLYALPANARTTSTTGTSDGDDDASERVPGTDAGRLIDTPGFQEFGLAHLTPGEVERAFPEFRPLLGKCRFYNCRHLEEPGCALLEAVAQGSVLAARHALFAALTHESQHAP